MTSSWIWNFLMHYICNVSFSSSTILNSLSYDNVIASDRRNCMCNAFSPMLRPCSRRRKYLYTRVDKWPYPYKLVGVIAYTFPNFIGNYIIHTAHRIQAHLKSFFYFDTDCGFLSIFFIVNAFFADLKLVIDIKSAFRKKSRIMNHSWVHGEPYSSMK